MLSIFYGDLKEAVYNTAAYFKYDYEDDWIVDPFVKKMIEDVDKSAVLDSGVIVRFLCSSKSYFKRFVDTTTLYFPFISQILHQTNSPAIDTSSSIECTIWSVFAI